MLAFFWRNPCDLYRKISDVDQKELSHTRVSLIFLCAPARIHFSYHRSSHRTHRLVLRFRLPIRVKKKIYLDAMRLSTTYDYCIPVRTNMYCWVHKPGIRLDKNLAPEVKFVAKPRTRSLRRAKLCPTPYVPSTFILFFP